MEVDPWAGGPSNGDGGIMGPIPTIPGCLPWRRAVMAAWCGLGFEKRAAAGCSGWWWKYCWRAGWWGGPYKWWGLAAATAAILIFSISASCNLLALALLFWNQILTWVSVRWRLLENSALSAIDKYCFSRNFFSKDNNCWVVNGVLGFRFGLCFLRLHFNFGGSPLLASAIRKKEKKIIKLHVFFLLSAK